MERSRPLFATCIAEMSSRAEFADNSAWSQPPYDGDDLRLCNYKLPHNFLGILRASNGLVTKGGLFRVFGTELGKLIPTIFEWNSAEWKREYGKLSEGLLFVAEDIFGDQYGYETRDDSEKFVKFYCEGGETEEVPGGFIRFREALAEPRGAGILDVALLDAAFESGLKPKVQEHLAFRLPLVVGGAYQIDNLEVENVVLHLGTLAQLSVRNASFPDGTVINRFETK